MADMFDKQERSKIMSRIRSKNTRAEVLVFKYLRKRAVYFQKHYSRIDGTPDIALPRKKKAVFIDGDFWHGRYFAHDVDRLPKEYWKEKIADNVARDKLVRASLRRDGWSILRVWESDIMRKKTREKCLVRIENFLTNKGNWGHRIS